MNCIHLNFVSDKEGRKFLSPMLPQDGLNEKTLNVVITDGDAQRTYPVFQQKAAFVEKYADLKPNGTISEVERKHFPEEVYTENYGKVMARQMPVSLYGISLILQEEGVSCEYIGNFEDKAAEKQMMEHLYKGKPVIIETSRMRRKGKRIVHFFDKKYAGSYHTMILLGVDEEGQIVFTDSATRDWAGEQQRLKRAKLPELISYMFPQKNVGDTHLYFSRKRNTGGYILIR